MSRFVNEQDYFHGKADSAGILLVNLGTPDAPDAPALRRYLNEFLSDPRVVEIPRLLWYPILNLAILPKRPRVSAEKYKKIWTEQGSPLLSISQQQHAAIQKELERRFQGPVKIELAMRYGNPSIQAGLLKLKAEGVRRLLIMPLYPQYSATTTASVFDAVFSELQTWRWVPELRTVSHYHDNPDYIEALSQSLFEYWNKNLRGEILVMSFHGIPKRNLSLGDPYYCECQKTARLLAENLNLRPQEYRVTFQSRFGKTEWLQPYTDKTLEELARSGTKAVDVICPGFAADCLETLEEIQLENKEVFLQAGGQTYQYVPALNTNYRHIQMLCDVIQQQMQGWPEASADWNATLIQKQAELTQKRAIQQGAKQ